MKEREPLNEFKPGDLFIYRNGDRYEIGKVKGIKDDTHCWQNCRIYIGRCNAQNLK